MTAPHDAKSMTLLPCPFCGGICDGPQNYGDTRDGLNRFVACRDCGANIYRFGPKPADADAAVIAAWNTRIEPVTAPARVEAVNPLWCENCYCEDRNHRHDAKLPLENMTAEQKAERFPATQIGIGPVRPEYKDRPPSYWCFCPSHGMLALIAGFNPVQIDSDEGHKRAAAIVRLTPTEPQEK